MNQKNVVFLSQTGPEGVDDRLDFSGFFLVFMSVALWLRTP